MADSPPHQPLSQASKRDEAPGVHWSKDAVEHIRTVHFTLIATCLALVVLASSGTPAEIGRARQEIQDIAELTKEELWDQDVIEKGAEDLLKQQANIRRNETLPVSRFAESEDFRPSSIPNHFALRCVEFVGPNWVLSGKAADKYTYFGGGQWLRFKSRRLPLPRPQTLQDFRDLWDNLNERHSVRIPTEISSTFYHFNKSGERKIETTPGQWKKVDPNCQPKDKIIFVSQLQEFPGEISHEYNYLTFEMDYVGFFPVLRYVDIAFDAQGHLIDRFPKDRHPPHGSFEYSFRALNAFTKNYQTLEIAKFDAILEAEQSRTGESFEAFGVKFPAQGTTRWGILVVLGIQLYFLIHLRELSGKLNAGDPGWDVAWIGVYESSISKIVFVVSAFVLPVCATAALGIRGLYVSDFGKLYWIIFLVGMLAGAGLAFAGWKYSLKMREQPSTTAIAAEENETGP